MLMVNLKCSEFLIVANLLYYRRSLPTSPLTKCKGRDLWQVLVMQASGSLVDVDIPEPSEPPWPGIDIFCTSMGLGRRIVKELHCRPETDNGND